MIARFACIQWKDAFNNNEFIHRGLVFPSGRGVSAAVETLEETRKKQDKEKDRRI